MQFNGAPTSPLVQMWIKIHSYFICNLGNLLPLLPPSRWATSSLEATISIIVNISVTLVTYLLYCPPLGGPPPLLNHHLYYSNYLCNLGNLPPLLPPLGGPPPLLNHHLYYSNYLCNLVNLPPLLPPLGGPPPLLNNHLYYSNYLCNLSNLPPLLPL